MHGPWAGFFFVLGSIFGSFANVVIFRFPKGESVVSPGSRCPKCQAPIAWRDKLPIISWFLLRGKCRVCGEPISPRYWIIELVTALLFLAAFLKLGWSWTLLEVLIFFLGLVIVSGIDLDHFLLPDAFTLPGMVLGLVGGALNPERHFIDALVGLLIGGGFLWAVAYFYFLLRKEEGMGGGDIKLLGWIGAVLGWQSIAFVIISSSIVGSIAGLIVAQREKKGMKTVIPFGPYLALGAVLYVLGGQFIAEQYAHFFLPFLFESP
jgi:leader peptidase (prepilin peptidase)/N-methyltransferase